MIDLKPHPRGVIIPVRGQPNARKTGVQGERVGALKVAVRAPPEEGRANAAIAEVLKDFFGIKRSRLELISGASSRDKHFLLVDCKIEEIRSKLVEFETAQ